MQRVIIGEEMYDYSDTSVMSTSIGKGETVFLAYTYWKAVMMDNYKTRVIRLADVYGFEHEMGDIYVHDISLVLRVGTVYPVILTESQKQLKHEVELYLGR